MNYRPLVYELTAYAGFGVCLFSLAEGYFATAAIALTVSLFLRAASKG